MHYHYIIAGQGIAGTLLAWSLIRQNKKVLVVDQFRADSSSQVAAGIYLPITGRRIVKSWMSDILIPYAEETYRELEKLRGRRFLYTRPLLEIFDSQKTANEWHSRSGDKDIAQFITQFLPKNFSDDFICPFGAVELNHSGYLDLPVFLSVIRNYFLSRQCLWEQNLDAADVKINDVVHYKNITADILIFAEGIRSVENIYFKHLPFQLSKGEMLLIHSTSLAETHIVNNGIFILPVGNQLFKVGSTYSWSDLNTDSTPEAKEKLLHQLKKITRDNFSVVSQLAAIRPTVKERRPFLGLLPSQPKIGIFNGLGTKGVMLAPYFANMLTEHLVSGKLLLKEVSVADLKI